MIKNLATHLEPGHPQDAIRSLHVMSVCSEVETAARVIQEWLDQVSAYLFKRTQRRWLEKDTDGRQARLQANWACKEQKSVIESGNRSDAL